MKKILFSIIILAVFGCKETAAPEQTLVTDFYQTELFKQVQLNSVFPDSKTFVDCTLKRSYEDILDDYKLKKNEDAFDIKAFVLENFELPTQYPTNYQSDTAQSMKSHINTLWPVLTRKADTYNENSSLIPLPHQYIVPGGRFREIYYWDSYFTIEGLLEAGEAEMANNMLDNFSFLIDSIGFVPNGNRAYYLGRSQPPFYSLILARIASGNRDKFLNYLPQLVSEYRFWMKGAKNVAPNGARARVVKLEDGTVLNRYWDNFTGPRPESYKEDYELVKKNELDSGAYKDLRAGAESGWDYSSRWFADHKNLKTIQATNIIPVDLNSLLYHLELKIAQGYNWKEQLDSAQYYISKADERKDAILKYLWDEEDGFFVDYNFVEKRPTGVHSLAAAYPLFFQIADKPKAKRTAERLINDFLLPGGFVTTLNDTGQQWDYPNGWAPLQWITVNALFNYGFDEDGLEAVERWLTRNKEVYKATGRMMEKYNVVDTGLLAGGGEYPLQDGFGWSNGVAIAFQSIFERKSQVFEPVNVK